MLKAEEESLVEVYRRLAVLALRTTLQEESHSCSEEDAWLVVQAFNSISSREFNVHPFPETAPTLRLLKDAGLRMGVVTNRPMSAVQLRANFNDVGLPDVFEVIITSLDIGFRKPHHSIFQAALVSLEIHAKDTAFVGDKLELDVLPPVAMGMKAVHLTDQAMPQDAYFSIRTLSELLHLNILQPPAR